MQGGNHVIAVKTDGTLWTWGYNNNGQLGDGTVANRASPVTTVAGGTNWSQLPGALTGDSLSSVAIKTDGTLWTWGRDNYGQLGDGTTVNKSSPITVAGGGTNWSRVNGFMGAISAVKTDGTLWTWGSNGFNGALGDGTTLNRSSPVTTAGGGTTWSNAMVNGTGPAVALKTDGTLWAWGGGTAGTAAGVGDGFAVQRSSPVTIAGGGTNWYAVSGGWTAAYALSSSTINSAVPTYLIAPTIATAGTGSQVTWFVSTTEVVDGTTLYYTNTGTFAGATRFSDGLNYGSVTVLSGFASLTKTIINDGTTNTTTNITLQLRTVSTAGSIVATATPVSVLPTITPTSTYNVYPSSDTVLSNNNLSWYVATTNVADGTPLYYTITGTTTSTFADGALYGSVTVNGNLAAINKFTNLLVSSSSIVAQIRTSSTSGSIVATATTVTASVDSRVVSIQYLVVGGGGGGGAGFEGGGGGAGGLLSASTYLFKGETITVGVGPGGTGGIGGSNPSPYGLATPGTPSYFSSPSISTITALGGGVGAGGVLGPSPGNLQVATPGGSGGGGSNDAGVGNTAGLGTTGQGYPGGAWNTTAYPFGGGGGGAGGAGTSTPGPASTTANPGGLAALWPYTNTYYAGGGGGGSRGSVTPVGYGGGVAPGNPAKGGAGDGGGTGPGGTGTNYTGGGGGGGGSAGGTANGGAGGSGVVAIAYASPSQLFIGGTMTPGAANPAAPGYYVHTFTSTGTLVSAFSSTNYLYYIWGQNNSGQIGDGTTIDRSSPTLLAGETTSLSEWKSLPVGFAQRATGGIKVDGTLWTWGYNSTGRLGDGTTLDRSSPVTTAGGGTTWSQVAMGLGSCSAVKTDGTLWTWGGNSFGQLGDGTTLSRSSPATTAGGGTTWKQVAIGQYITGAIKTDGTLWTWGYNNSGTLGDGTTLNRSSPATTVGGGTTWSQVACGYYNLAAIKTDGTLWTWGYNTTYGGLGDGTVINKSSPVTTAGGGTTWSQVSVGYNTSAAVKTDGTLWIWGYNNSGQLGDGTTLNRSSPVTTVAGGTTWKQVACGYSIAAIKTDGTLWTWGYNIYGQLGDGTTINRSSPASISSLTWSSIGAFNYGFVALR
jgi:alpha-tubulin suppressor-like RCC1 family protein